MPDRRRSRSSFCFSLLDKLLDLVERHGGGRGGQGNMTVRLDQVVNIDVAVRVVATVELLRVLTNDEVRIVKQGRGVLSGKLFHVHPRIAAVLVILEHD